MAAIFQTTLYFVNQTSLSVFPLAPINIKMRMGSNNGLATNRRQAII